jgi:putative transposase
MARPMRIEFPGAVYRITARGNEHKKVFLNDRDRETFLKTLQQVKDRFHWLCHSYVLMDNHYHLLIETVEANLSRGMRQLNGTYTQYFNRRHSRVGHLFQGRFKSILVEKADCLLEVSRYIVLNPVRAGMAVKAEEWPWSSYRATIGMEELPQFLTADWLLGQFGPNKKQALAEFKQYIKKGIGVEYPTESLQAGLILGSERFVERVQGLIEAKIEFLEIPRPQRCATHKNIAEICYEGARKGANRDELIYQSYVRHGYTMKEIADYLKVHYASVSRSIKRYENKRKK